MIRRTVQLILISLVLLLVFLSSSIPYYSYVTHRKMDKALHHAYTNQLWDVPSGVGKEFIPILMPVCQRPEYLEPTFKALVDVQDISQTVIVVSQDCGIPQVTQLIHEYSSKLKIVHMDHISPYYSIPSAFYTSEYRTSANIKSLLTFAFEYMLADGAIILESDLVPARDFYIYNRWMYQRYLDKPLASSFPHSDKPEIFSINSFNINSRKESNDLQFRKARFSSWGWMTSRDRWHKVLKPGWTWMGGWDLVIDRKLYPKHNLISLTPELSRVRMIGLHGINVKEDTPERSRPFLIDMYMREDSRHHYSYDGAEPVIVT